MTELPASEYLCHRYIMYVVLVFHFYYRLRDYEEHISVLKKEKENVQTLECNKAKIIEQT